ncbi:MAG TPA: hypothetical protein VIF62_16800 [Labilithrix sp.]|jgi:hypothetical protein
MTDVRPLLPDEIFARKRPRAIAFVYAWELFAALVIATPGSAWARIVFGANPDGDAIAWAPGAHYLMTWLGAEDHALPVALRTTTVLLFAAMFVAQLPLGVLLAALATGTGESGRSPRVGQSLRSAAGSFVSLAAIFVLAGTIEILVLAGGAFASGALETPVANSAGDLSALLAAISVFLPFALLAAIVGVVADLARAAIVREVAIAEEAPPFWRLVALGVRRGVRARIRRATLEWAPRWAIGVALVALGAIASELLGGRGGFALVALFFAHQLVTLLRVVLRASWLARALRLVA